MQKSTEVKKLTEVDNRTYLPDTDVTACAVCRTRGDPAPPVHEFTVIWNSSIFNIVFGQYSHGWFIAVVNWKKCFNAAHPVDVSDNSRLLCEALGFTEDVTDMLAEKIKEKWEGE